MLFVLAPKAFALLDCTAPWRVLRHLRLRRSLLGAMPFLSLFNLPLRGWVCGTFQCRRHCFALAYRVAITGHTVRSSHEKAARGGCVLPGERAPVVASAGEHGEMHLIRPALRRSEDGTTSAYGTTLDTHAPGVQL